MANRIPALVLSLAILSAGCAAANYRPTSPLAARSGDLELDLRLVRIGPGQEFFLRTRSTSPHTIREGWLTAPGRVPCTGGRLLERIEVDGEEQAALAPGSHQLRARFGAPLEDLQAADLVLDLQLEGSLCARTPVISQSLPLEAATRFVLLGSLGIEGNQTLRGVDALEPVRLGGGGWMGPVLLTAEAGVGLAVCERLTCGKEGENGRKSGLAIPLAADLRYAFTPQIRNNVLLLVPMLGLRYSYTAATVPALDGDRHVGLHGVHAMFSWCMSMMFTTNGPFRHAERTPLLELVLPVGVLMDPGGPSRTVGFSAGFGMRTLFPL